MGLTDIGGRKNVGQFLQVWTSITCAETERV
jgi:hypothetical protein